MSVVGSATEVSLENPGTQTLAGWTIVRAFEVTVDDANDSPPIVIAAGGIPAIGAAHPDMAAALCFQRRVTPRGNRLHYTVSCSYETPSASQPIRVFTDDDPTNDDPIIQFRTLRTVKEPGAAFQIQAGGPPWVPTDSQNDPEAAIDNSSNEPFQTIPSIDVADLEIEINQNEAAFDGDTIRAFVNTINDRAITIAGVDLDPLEGRITDISAEKRIDSQNNTFWKVRYVIALRNEYWFYKIIDRGFTTWLANVRADITYADDAGNQVPVTEAAYLDGSGDENPVGNDPVVLNFMVYFPKNWATLSLPTTT